jgi:hypothetical protein
MSTKVCVGDPTPDIVCPIADMSQVLLVIYPRDAFMFHPGLMGWTPPP